MTLDPAFKDHLIQALGLPPGVLCVRSVSGGDRSQAYALRYEPDSGAAGRSFFLKTNRSSFLDEFRIEREGLTAIDRYQAIRCPRPLADGTFAGRSYLILEWLMLERRGDFSALARGLAELHANGADYHGLDRAKFSGGSLEKYRQERDSGIFFTQSRLAPKIRLAVERGFSPTAAKTLRELFPRIEDFLGGVPSSAAHGDLWGGNFGFCDGEPVIFDPAFHYADSEADLAMTELFGGFPAEFYHHYQAIRPLSSDYPLKRDIFNLYHLINHFNLFGSGYASQSEETIHSVVRRLI